MKKDTPSPKEINVKFGKKVAENITKATQLIETFKAEHQKADQARNSLIESVLLTASGLDSLEGYQVKSFDVDNGEAVLIKI